MPTTIINVRVFDGEKVLSEDSVTFDGDRITAVGAPAPEGSETVDGQGCTLLPGLIDAHVHTDLDALRDALRFGVTTELEMFGGWTPAQRHEVAERDDVADLRTSMLGVTAPDGHPFALMKMAAERAIAAGQVPHAHPQGQGVSGPDEAVAFVAAQIAAGADYIKVLIEDGDVVGVPGLPVPTQETLRGAVDEAHRQGRLALAHALTAAGVRSALAAGVDGLTHLFVDEADDDIVQTLVERDVFVISCMVTDGVVMGRSSRAFGSDERVSSRLGPDWYVDGALLLYPQGDFGQVLRNFAILREAGVELLAGTDAAPELVGGVAHGASLHEELQLMVQGGMTPTQALASATGRAAKRFGLSDRGRVVAGARADLLLVGGDPTSNIGDTLSTRAIWRRGTRLAQPTAVTG